MGLSFGSESISRKNLARRAQVAPPYWYLDLFGAQFIHFTQKRITCPSSGEGPPTELHEVSCVAPKSHSLLLGNPLCVPKGLTCRVVRGSGVGGGLFAGCSLSPPKERTGIPRGGITAAEARTPCADSNGRLLVAGASRGVAEAQHRGCPQSPIPRRTYRSPRRLIWAEGSRRPRTFLRGQVPRLRQINRCPPRISLFVRKSLGFCG